MTAKSVKSNLLPLGVISAISVTGLLLGGMAANAQTNSTQMNQSPSNTNQLPSNTNQSPSGINQSPTQLNPTPAQPNQPMDQLPQNTAPKTSSINQYSPNQAPILRLGSQGDVVKDVQAFLNEQGLYSGASDGVYGYQTRAAVTQFQRARNLPVDGIIGPQTWGAMINRQVQQ